MHTQVDVGKSAETSAPPKDQEMEGTPIAPPPKDKEMESTTTSPPQKVVIPEGFMKGTDSVWYKVIKKVVPYEVAFKICKEIGGDGLGNMLDEEESKAVDRVFKTTFPDTRSLYFWTGMTMRKGSQRDRPFCTTNSYVLKASKVKGLIHCRGHAFWGNTTEVKT